MIKENRKTRYTKMVIKNALQELLQKRSLDKITIKELTELADINRSTFYLHYENIESLIQEIELEYANEIIQCLELSNYNKSNFKIEKINSFVNLVCENQTIAFWLLDSNVTGIGKKIVRQHIQNNFIPLWMNNKKISNVEAEYMFEYMFDGAIGLLTRWYNCPEELSITQLKKIFHKTIYSSLALVH